MLTRNEIATQFCAVEAVVYSLLVNNMLQKLQDDPLLFDYNVKDRVNDFIVAAMAQVHLTFSTLAYVLLILFCNIISVEHTGKKLHGICRDIY